MSEVTAALLKKYDFSYDHSQGYRDFQPFYARVGDEWNVIDYTKKAKAQGFAARSTSRARSTCPPRTSRVR